MSQRIGITQKKIMLLLLGGITLGLSGSPRRYFRVLNIINKEWHAINRRALHTAIRKLYASRLVDEHLNEDGSLTLVLSKEGDRRALRFKVEEMQIKKPNVWDKKWRIIVFDIPEHKRKVRDSLRRHLQLMNFYELQKSVFVHPFRCEDEIEFLTELYNIRLYVRQITAETIDNELHLKKYFCLL